MASAKRTPKPTEVPPQWQPLARDLDRMKIPGTLDHFIKYCQDNPQTLLPFKWKFGQANRKQMVFFVFDVRKHVSKEYYYLHNYEASMAMVLKGSRHKGIDEQELYSTQRFYASDKHLPTPTEAYKRLVADIQDKRKIRLHKYKPNGRSRR